MFIFFSKYKANYHQEKGQVFPFLIAVAVVIIIMIMITVNLGQVGVIKTENSNAADAGALAGTSVLSGTLLGLGLKSDYMFGYAVIMITAITLACVFWWTGYGIYIAISLYIAYITHEWVQYLMALGEGRLGWTSAKQTALKYAFNNMNVDEPRVTYNHFAQMTGKSYEEYLKGEDRNILMTGFNRFMSDPKEGFWQEAKFGRMDPGSTSSAVIKSGYGWGRWVEYCCDIYGKPYWVFEIQRNSYDERAEHVYTDYANYVEAQVFGSVLYPLQFGSKVSGECMRQYLTDRMWIPWWLGWMDDALGQTLDMIEDIFIKNIAPTNLALDQQNEFLENNPITVRVKKVKMNGNLGLWNFRYGGDTGISSAASACVFAENGDETIETSVIDTFCQLFFLLSGTIRWEEWFNTKKHLFESKLIYTN